jgi:hypothetical protein
MFCIKKQFEHLSLVIGRENLLLFLTLSLLVLCFTRSPASCDRQELCRSVWLSQLLTHTKRTQSFLIAKRFHCCNSGWFWTFEWNFNGFFSSPFLAQKFFVWLIDEGKSEKLRLRCVYWNLFTRPWNLQNFLVYSPSYRWKTRVKLTARKFN